MSLGQLKILQEVITLSGFEPVAWLYMDEPVTLNPRAMYVRGCLFHVSALGMRVDATIRAATDEDGADLARIYNHYITSHGLYFRRSCGERR